MPRLLPPLLILAVGLIAFHNSLRAAFVFDDIDFLVIDRTTHSFEPSDLRPAGDPFAGRPVPVLSFILNHRLAGGLHAPSYHATNLAIHLAAGLTLYALLRRTLRSPRLADRFAKHATPLSACAALLFTAHPLTTEVVDYAFQRTESLMALFSLLTLYCVSRLRSPAPSSTSLIPPPSSLFWSLAALLCAALAVSSKQPAYALPILALLYDRTFFSPTWRTTFTRPKFLYPALALTWPLLLFLQLVHTNYASVGPTARFTPYTWLLTQSTLLTRYLRLVLVPHPLLIDYSDWPVPASLTQVWPHVLLLAGLFLASLYALVRRHHPAGLVGVACFLVLAPTSSLLPIPTELGAERRMYLPLALLLPLIVATAYLLLTRHSPNRDAIKILTRATAVLLIPNVILCIRRNSDYADPVTLWSRTVAIRPDNARAWTNLGDAFARAGQPQFALPAFQRAAAIEPDSFKARRNLGAVLFQLRRPAEAVPELRRALGIMEEPHARADLGRALLAAGDADAALAEFARAAESDPRNPDLLNDYGNGLLRRNQPAAALEQFRAALAADPAHTDAAINAALAHSALGDPKQSAATLRAALERNPDHPRGLQSLAWLLLSSPDPAVRDPGAAVPLAERAAALSPPQDAPAALGTLAAAQAATGNVDAAVATLIRARPLAEQHAPDLVPTIDAHLARYRARKALPTSVPAATAPTSRL